MTGTVAISLLSSLTLFLGLTALARRRLRRESWNFSGAALALLGLCGVTWMVLAGEVHLAAPAVLIGLLGYCFGHFTTPRPAPAHQRPASPQPAPGRLGAPEEKAG